MSIDLTTTIEMEGTQKAEQRLRIALMAFLDFTW